MANAEREPRLESEPYSDNPYIGFQTRLLLGGDYLNPQTTIDHIDDLNDKNVEYTAINSVSNNERLAYWRQRQERGGQMTFDKQKETWKSELKTAFDRKKAFFENDQNRRWVELYEQFEINAKEFDEHQAEKLYDKFFNNETNDSHDSRIERFVALVADRYKNKGESGNYDYDGLTHDMEAVKWIAGIFGHEHATEIITNLTDLAGKKEVGKLQNLADRADEKALNTEEKRVNVLTDKEKELLDVIWENREHVKTEEQEKKEATTGEEPKGIDYQEIPPDEPFNFIKDTLHSSHEHEEAFRVSFDNLEKILNADNLSSLPENITISDVIVSAGNYNILRVEGNFTKETSGNFSFEIGTRKENELYVPGYMISTETGGKGGGGDIVGIEKKLSQYLNTAINSGWEVSGYEINDSNLRIHFKRGEEKDVDEHKAPSEGGSPAPTESGDRNGERVEPGSLVRQFEKDNPHLLFDPRLFHEDSGESYQNAHGEMRTISIFTARDSGITLVDVPDVDKNQDSVGFESRSDGIINIAVADGVSSAVYSKAASRLGVQAALTHLIENTPSNDTIDAVREVVSDPQVYKIAEDLLSGDSWISRSQKNTMKEKKSSSSSTMLIAAQYDQAHNKLRYALRGDSQIAVYRSDGTTDIIKGQTNDQIYFGSHNDPRFNHAETIVSEMSLNRGDVALLQSDGLEKIPNIHRKISDFIANYKGDYMNSDLALFLREEIKNYNPPDDVSTVILVHQKEAGDSRRRQSSEQSIEKRLEKARDEALNSTKKLYDLRQSGASDEEIRKEQARNTRLLLGQADLEGQLGQDKEDYPPRAETIDLSRNGPLKELLTASSSELANAFTPEAQKLFLGHILQEVDQSIETAKRMSEAQREEIRLGAHNLALVVGIGAQSGVYQRAYAAKTGKVLQPEQIARMPVKKYLNEVFDYDLSKDTQRVAELQARTNMLWPSPDSPFATPKQTGRSTEQPLRKESVERRSNAPVAERTVTLTGNKPLLDETHEILRSSTEKNIHVVTTPQQLIKFARSIDLPGSARITAMDATIVGKQLRSGGEIKTPVGTVKFNVTFENDQRSGIRVVSHDVKLPLLAKGFKGQVESSVSNLNNLLRDQINKEMKGAGQTTGFRIEGSRLVFDFEK